MIGALAVQAAALASVAAATTPSVPYAVLAPGLALIGVGAASLFAPIQATLVAAVRPAEQGQASGAATAVREVGSVVGVAVLAAVFAAHGNAASADALLAGFRPALALAALAAAAGLAALALPARHRALAPRAPERHHNPRAERRARLICLRSDRQRGSSDGLTACVARRGTLWECSPSRQG